MSLDEKVELESRTRSAPMTDRIAFVDCETTGLVPGVHAPWEIAVATLDLESGATSEHLWQVEVDLRNADPMALRLSGFYERAYQVTGTVAPHRAAEAAYGFAKLTAGTYLAGAVVSFDAGHLNRFLRHNGQAPTWHHRIICVETFAAGVLGLDVPVGLAETARLLAVPVDDDATHTALYDAVLARDVYQAVRSRARGQAAAA